MNRRLLGLETEYAFSVPAGGSKAVTREIAVTRLVKSVGARMPHLPGGGSVDLYLANGCRLYIDAGLHPEFCTPECESPTQCVSFVRAGERLLGEQVDELARGKALGGAAVYRCNVDYSGSNATWGCHESYLHSCDRELLAKELISHLVSRVIYTGAGGFWTTSQGLAFSLSPRVGHLRREISDSSTSDRGILHTKDEPHARDFHRLHLLCGESLCSDMAAWLKMGTTALVVAMIEQGLRPGKDVSLRRAVSAMQMFASDPTCRCRVRAGGNKSLSALEIQWHYLKQAEMNLGRSFMPEWADEVCRQWRAALDRLAGGPQEVSTTLDWAIKLAMYQEYASSLGVAWSSLPNWSFVLERLFWLLERTPRDAEPVTAEYILDADSPARPMVAELTPYLKACGLEWSGLKPFIQLRAAMFEIDTRFGQLGPAGIFSAMDRQGVLDHSVEGVDVEDALVHPPPGRASVRGKWIRDLHGSAGQYVAGWSHIDDLKERRVVDLADPFVENADWRPLEAGEYCEPRWLHHQLSQELYQQIRRNATVPRPSFAVGQQVVVALIPSGACRDLLGRRATITTVGGDERGEVYALDIDDGRHAWRTGHLVPASASP